MGGDLRAADRAARTEVPAQTIDGASTPCPLAHAWVIEVSVIGADERPLAAVPVQLVAADGRAVASQTDTSGVARFTGLEKVDHAVALYELDGRAWEEIRVADLATPKELGAAAAAWEAARAPAPRPSSHVVEDGDCVETIGVRYGFFPDDVWNDAGNDRLRDAKRDPHLLVAGDEVALPPFAPKTIDVGAGKRISLRRKGVPAWFRVRFEDAKSKPRAGVEYALRVETPRGPPVKDKIGKLNDDGSLEERIPADATKAVVTLKDRGTTESFEFDLGHVDPIDRVAGVKARLESLGYACDEGQAAGEKTVGAIRRFEWEHGLEPTGDATNDDFRRALEKAYRI